MGSNEVPHRERCAEILGALTGHVLDAIALVRDQFDVVEVLVFEDAKHIVKGIVEPGPAQIAAQRAACDQNGAGDLNAKRARELEPFLEP